MKKLFDYFLVLGLVLAISTVNVAFAGQIQLGTATGGLAIKYNNLDVNGDRKISGYDEKSANQAYTRAQYSYDNTNGMGFQFASGWDAIFSGQQPASQFGFDLFAKAPTFSNLGGVSLPTIQFADYTGVGADYSAVNGPSSWAINDYKFGIPIGPENPSNVNFNSLFRGTSFTMNTNSYTVTNDVDLDGVSRPRYFTIGISGTLVTDGLIHWYSPTTPNTALSSWGYEDTFTYTGSLTYDTFYGLYNDSRKDYTYNGINLENGSDQLDLYSGTMTLYAQTRSAVPEPATMLLLGLGLVGLAGARRKFKK